MQYDGSEREDGANDCHFKETLKFIPGESAVVT